MKTMGSIRFPLFYFCLFNSIQKEECESLNLHLVLTSQQIFHKSSQLEQNL